ncbi:hypothetical protein [Antrihabitans stalactiti]|uniref:hypothetical protein n=1 Tax=Antrihabitans stalactiti TaxID=2584121 RepID=UPI00146E8544|nr:hypothetical protein [Antrihabitans stalactiti]
MQLYIYLTIYAFVFAPMLVPPVVSAVVAVARFLSTQVSRIPAASGERALPRFAVAEA